MLPDQPPLRVPDWGFHRRTPDRRASRDPQSNAPPLCTLPGHTARMGTAVVDALTAAGITYRRTDFADPHLPGPTALTVTADGHVYGHLAIWGSCHIGYGDQCVTPPSSTSGYQYFHQGIVDTDDGALPVGKITLGTGHAGLGEDAATAAAHYDNTGAVTAVVRAGEDQHGIWLAGRLVPGIGDQRVDELRRSGVSGDWRGINGNLELVAALAVNVPGFPVPRTEQLVASGGVSTLVAAGIVPPASALLPQSVAELDAYVLSKVRAVARAEVARTRLADARSVVASARRTRRAAALDVLAAVTASAHEQRATRAGRARDILGDATSRVRRARDARAMIAAATAPPDRATIARDTITAAPGVRGLNRGADPINRGIFSSWTTSSSPTPDATAPAKAAPAEAGAHTFTAETLGDELRAIGISEATTNAVTTRATIDDLTAAAVRRVRRVRTPAGAKRYKQPIGSIIIARPGKKALNLSAMGDSDLTELMGDAAAQDKNPDVYEAAFTEWARRQPDREEPGPDIDDRVGPPEDLDSVQLDLVRAELDTATADLKARIDSGGPDVDAAIARVEVAEGLLRHEQKMAAARAGANDGARPETATSTAGDAPAVEATPERAQAWNTVRDTETKAEQDGTGFEEALGRSPEETAAAIAERDAVRDGYTSAADKARDEQDVSADPAPAGPPASEDQIKTIRELREMHSIEQSPAALDYAAKVKRKMITDMAEELALSDAVDAGQHPIQQEKLGVEMTSEKKRELRRARTAAKDAWVQRITEQEAARDAARAELLDAPLDENITSEQAEEMRRILAPGIPRPDGREWETVTEAVARARRWEPPLTDVPAPESADKKASTGLPAMSDNDIIRKAESLAAQKRFGQDVQQEIAALKSEAARRNPGLDMAVGGILAIDVRQAREQGVRSSRQRTRWRRR